MKSLKCLPESNYTQFPERCSDQNSTKNHSISSNTLIQKKKFNDPLLPKNIIDNNTTFGRKTNGDNCIGDVIFPNRSKGKTDKEIYEYKKELYKVSHHSYDPGEQINRKYTKSFIQDYRYGKTNKRLPAGIWFKNNLVDESSNQYKNIHAILTTGNENEHCRYPYVDHRQGKFLGRSYFKVENIITKSEPDEKEFELMEYLAAVNKLKYTVRRKKDSLNHLRETYKLLDKESTGWLPLEQVYAICYQQQIWPEKKLFDLALNSIDAINNDNVRYDLFADLLDPNVKFTPSFEILKKEDQRHRFVPTYKNDYEDKLSQSVEQNKNLGYQHIYTPVKPIVLAHQNCFGYETNVKTLLNPTIFSNYGLTYRDFYIGRDKDTIDKLFRDVGVSLPSDIFNVIWDNAYRCGGYEDKVSVEVFRQALQDYANRLTESQDNESDD